MRLLSLLAFVLLVLGQEPLSAQSLPTVGCAGEKELPLEASKVRAPYPFDVARIREALKRRDLQTSVNVLVVDNGFAGFDNQAGPWRATANFPEVFFFRDPATGRSQPTYNYVSPGTRDIAGTWGHGTHITGIVLGGMYGLGVPTENDPGNPGVRQLFFENFDSKPQPGRPTNEWLKLFVASLRKDKIEWDVDLLLGLPRSTSVPSSLRKKADIVNMSLLSPPNYGGREDALRGLPGEFPLSLVVVSAGNDGAALREGRDASYPAMSDGKDGNLIVVAAHNSNGDLFELSNRHPTRVTIAAPGCAIKSWFSGAGAPEAANGTSQAAAIVTFDAALLKSRWGQVDPNDLRERLITSSRYSRLLSNGCRNEKPECVRWGSMLDIEMSLYIDTDVVEYCVDGKTGAEDCATKLALGTLQGAPPALTTCVEAKGFSVQAPLVQGMNFSRSGAIRATWGGRFQVIFRARPPGNQDSLEMCETDGLPPGNLDFVLDAKQPDGLPDLEGRPARSGEIWHLPLDRVVRVVTRSIDNIP